MAGCHALPQETQQVSSRHVGLHPAWRGTWGAQRSPKLTKRVGLLPPKKWETESGPKAGSLLLVSPAGHGATAPKELKNGNWWECALPLPSRFCWVNTSRGKRKGVWKLQHQGPHSFLHCGVAGASVSSVRNTHAVQVHWAPPAWPGHLPCAPSTTKTGLSR